LIGEVGRGLVVVVRRGAVVVAETVGVVAKTVDAVVVTAEPVHPAMNTSKVRRERRIPG
jgi:hypothetical protein